MRLLNESVDVKKRKHVSRLHEMLDYLGEKIVDPDEIKARSFGPQTLKALNKLQQRNNIPQSAEPDRSTIELLNRRAIEKYYSTKTQVTKLHYSLMKAARIAKMDCSLPDDLKKRTIGEQTNSAIRDFQKKYRLAVTGELNRETIERLQSVTASKSIPVKKLKVSPTERLMKVRNPIRLNMRRSRVGDLQKALAWAGFVIDTKEFSTQTYGNTTRKAVIEFQLKYALPVSGNVGWKTADKLNSIIRGNSRMVTCKDKYRVRGTVRDELWQGVKLVTVQIYEKRLRDELLLAERKTLSNGFYDVQYSPPFNSLTGKPRENFQLHINVIGPDGNLIHDKLFQVTGKVLWANFTKGIERYAGESHFNILEKLLKKSLGPNHSIGNIEETRSHQDISFLRKETLLAGEDIMKMALAYRASAFANQPVLTPEVFYAFIRQNLPHNIPGDLLPDRPDEWNSWINMLVEQTVDGIAFLEPDLKEDALNSALKQNYVSRYIARELPQIMSALDLLKTKYVLEKPMLEGSGNVRTLLSASTINENQYPDVAGCLGAAKGFTDRFWKSLKKVNGLTPAAINDLRITVDLGYITSSHPDTLSFLKNKIAAKSLKQFKTTADLAKLSNTDWMNLISENGNKLPSWIEGGNISAKKETYARLLRKNAEKLYPAISFISGANRSDKHALGKLDRILKAVESKKDYVLKRDNINLLLKNSGVNLNKNEVVALKVLQRIHRITESGDAGVLLLESGYYSAAQVCYQGKDIFVNTLTENNISKSEAIGIFNTCENHYFAAIAMLSEYRFELHKAEPGCISSQIYSAKEIETLKKTIPDIETLFGPLDIREVKHCESVLGPSAYLTDLFRFLDQKQSKLAGNTVKDILFRRRPDLGNIKLNCRNTDTAMPYIDLVCEILENRVIGGTGSLDFQSTWPSEELIAEPEQVEAQAYEKLKNEAYPIFGSFNLWQEEVRAFLEHLGIPRYHLMQTFLVDITPATAKNNKFRTASEYFRIPLHEQSIITTPRPSNAWQKKYWSSEAMGANITVSTFLNKTGLDYRQLLGLLQCRFVNSDPPVSAVLCPIDNFALDQQKVQDMSVSRMDKMNRFIRLWKKAGMKMRELDLLIMDPYIGKADLDKDFLINLKKFEELRKILKLGVEEFAAFFGPINTQKVISSEQADKKELNLFERLFLSGSIDQQVYTDFSKLLTAASTNKDLDQYSAHLLSSLSMNNDELALLLPLTDQKLTLASLSILFRYTALSRQLKLRIKDLFLFMELTGVSSPFDSLETIEEIITNKRLLQEAGVSLVELEYLLKYTESSSAGLRDKAYVQKTQALREALVALRDKIAECEKAGEDSLEMLFGMLRQFEDESDIMRAMDIIAGTWAASQTEIIAFITDKMGVFVSDVDEAVSILKYTAPVSAGELEARRKYVLTELLNYFNRTTVKEFVSVTFGMESSQAEILLDQLHLPGKTDHLLTVLQDDKLHLKNSANEYEYEVSPADLPDVFSALQLLHKASVLVLSLKLNAAELEWFVMNHSKVNTPDLAQLPVSSSQPAVDFEPVLQLLRFIRFKRNFPEPENASFFNVLDLAANASSAQIINDELCKVTGWEPVEHSVLHFPSLDYCSPQTYELFLERHRQRKVTGSDFQSLYSWARCDEDDLEQAKARKAREIVKAKYGREQCLKVFRSIQDKLRERKREALVAYLVEESQRTKPAEILVSGQKARNPEYWTTPNDLYGWFLIDVEMCSEQLTSRIKQAISSVQLFVQRCFLNLENREVEVAQPDPDIENSWLQWQWMKNYRIWEANRKVFLYPENWIEPELRDNKSPFFKELESDILSKEATDENVEASLQRYIQKLEEVAHLEVCSIFHEINGPVDLLHVVARTQNMPPAYFYRNYDRNYERWSPWEKIETDIHSDHVVPYVYNRKLHLFWLIFHDKPIKLKNLPPVKATETTTMNPEPAKQLEIELAWIVRQPEGWDTKKISKNKLIHPWERPAFSYSVKPRYKSADNSLYIDLFISTSREFNDNTFYDQYSHSKIRLTSVNFDERLRPWHSSTFVFNGNVKEILLRGIPGYYFNSETGGIQNITSYEYVKGNFGDEGNNISELKIITEQLALPSGMHFKYTRLRNNQTHNINKNKFNVFGSDRGTKTLLTGGQDPFEAVLCHQGLSPVAGRIRPLFYQDKLRSFFILQDKKDIAWNYQSSGSEKIYSAYPFYHPFAELFQQEINRGGVKGLYQRSLQLDPRSYSNTGSFSFKSAYQPIDTIRYERAETEDLDFTRSGAYSIYNWELFFHAPFMIACRLSRNQRFEEAVKWFHYIFDPTSTEMFPTPQRFWITNPFHNTSDATYRQQRITNIIENIDQFKAQLTEWKNHPFKPHLIAEYRTVAYQKTIVMKYIDNLVSWGDQLFRRDTIESINEATLLYILAYELLGRRPVIVPALDREEKTFNELETEGELDTFGNTKVAISLENTLGLPITYTQSGPSEYEQAPSLEISYYGIPHNDKLLKYWDTVEDRLFKIRHGFNIEGLKRQLPLFEPPIDPALLVKAAAAGLDPADVLSDMNAPMQSYRFEVLAGKAVDFCHEVKGLGQQLLNALEKKDAEALSVLRASNEMMVLEAMHGIKKLRIDEIQNTILSLERRKEACQINIDHIKSLSVKLDAEEQAAQWSTAADILKVLGRVSTGAAALFAPAPDAQVGANGAGGSPKATVRAGGSNVVKAFKYTGKALEIGAEICKWRKDSLDSEAKSQRTKADRQARIAAEEKQMDSLEKQRLANEIIRSIAEKELEDFEKEVELRKAEQEYLQDKYTNEQLYQWMISQISSVYFQAYQLAYDMAKRAEKSYRRELGQADTSFIQFGYWDSLKKGLLSSERLNYDIRRMEASYLDQHKRELEIAKHVSLSRLAPDKLLELKLTGRCLLDLEEWMYNLDYPGHYRRRIKSVSVSVLCQADDFTNLNCRLTLQNSEIRTSNLVSSGYAKTGEDDTRFVMQSGSGESIATSHGKYDNGLFELKFDDDRFLPFEGAGAISSWDIHMPPQHNQFDFSTITDLILHVSYTAQEGGETLAAAAKTELDQILPDRGMLVVGLKYLFPTEWDAFLEPESAGSEQKLDCLITRNFYPFLARIHEIGITKAGLVIAGRHSGDYIARVSIPGQPDIDCTLQKDSSLNNYHHKPDVFEGAAPATGEFSIRVRRDTSGNNDFTSLPNDDIDDMYLILNYE